MYFQFIKNFCCFYSIIINLPYNFCLRRYFNLSFKFMTKKKLFFHLLFILSQLMMLEVFDLLFLIVICLFSFCPTTQILILKFNRLVIHQNTSFTSTAVFNFLIIVSEKCYMFLIQQDGFLVQYPFSSYSWKINFYIIQHFSFINNKYFDYFFYFYLIFFKKSIFIIF